MQVINCIAVQSHTLPMILAKMIKNSGVLESDKTVNNPQITGTVNTLIQPCIFSLDARREQASRVGIVFIICPHLTVALHFPTWGLVSKSCLLFHLYFRAFNDVHQDF